MTYMICSRPDVIDWQMMNYAIRYNDNVGLTLLWAACPDEKTKRKCANLGLCAAACESRNDFLGIKRIEGALDTMRVAHALGADDFDTALHAAVHHGTVAGMRLCISWGAILTNKMISCTGATNR